MHYFLFIWGFYNQALLHYDGFLGLNIFYSHDAPDGDLKETVDYFWVQFDLLISRGQYLLVNVTPDGEVWW